jgi:23S rRNA pseudouridine2605 synthase
VEQSALDRLKQGIEIAGIRYGAIEARIERRQGTNLWLSFALKEGKNREIKRVCENLGLQVNRLIRISYGPFQLGDLGKGEVEEVPPRVLRDQLGGLVEAKRFV